MSRIEELKVQMRRSQAEIDEIHRREQHEAHERGMAQSPKFNAMTPGQQRHCEFMGFDPDNPDIPLD